VTGDPAPGLAAERTALAWQRTALALVANGVLLLVREPLGGLLGVVVAVAAFALAGSVASVGRRRARQLQDRRPPALRSGEPVRLGVAVTVLVLCTAVAVLLQ